MRQKYTASKHLYVNKFRIGQELYENGTYVEYLNKGTQEAYMIKYMMILGMSRLEIQKRWKELYLTYNDPEYENEYDIIFSGKYKRAKNVRFAHVTQYAEVTQEEIDKVNTMKYIQPWVRQAVLLWLMDEKLSNVKAIRPQHLDLTSSIKATGQKLDDTNITAIDIIHEMQRIGILMEEVVTHFNPAASCVEDEWVMENRYVIYRPENPKILGIIDSAYDVAQWFEKITTTGVCPNCHKEFSVSQFARTILCPECYKASLIKRRNASRAEWRKCHSKKWNKDASAFPLVEKERECAEGKMYDDDDYDDYLDNILEHNIFI